MPAPPTTSARPSGSRTATWSRRGCVMEPVALHVPPAADAGMLESSQSATAIAAARSDRKRSPMVAIEFPPTDLDGCRACRDIAAGQRFGSLAGVPAYLVPLHCTSGFPSRDTTADR